MPSAQPPILSDVGLAGEARRVTSHGVLPSGYRREIDGLRAVAVLPVILFHAGFQSFGGGFVGVDVFFVISGYLITSIILAEREAGTFTFAGFYERRARRILPALFLVMTACVGLGWVYLLPAEMKSFGQGITLAAAFAANIFFYLKGGDYFGLQSEGNPLLHLWSLGVEEQYYLFFPVLLALAWKLGRQRVVALLAVAALASLAAAQWGSANRPSAAFYLLPARGWELLVGSFLAFRPGGEAGAARHGAAIDQSLSMVGLLLTAYAVFGFDEHIPFPSFHTLIPTVGAALIIAFARQDTLVGKLLGSKPLVGVGLVSYSAYLWHQPLFAFGRMASREKLDSSGYLVLSVLSLVLAYFTWRFVETPFRARQTVRRPVFFAAAFVIGTALVLFGVVGHYNSGYPDRNPLYARLASNFGLSIECNGNYSINAPCATSREPEVAVWGNSYAMHLVDGLGAAYPDKTLVQLTQDSCAPYPGVQAGKVGKLDCGVFYQRSLSQIVATDSIRLVVVSSTFRDLLDGANATAFEDTIRRLRLADKRVIIVGPTPSSGVDFAKCFVAQKSAADLRACDFRRRDIGAAHFDIVARLRAIAARHGAGFWDITDAICEGEVCRASVGETLIYRDSGHLSREGSRYVLRTLSAGDPGGMRSPESIGSE